MSDQALDAQTIPAGPSAAWLEAWPLLVIGCGGMMTVAWTLWLATCLWGFAAWLAG